MTEALAPSSNPAAPCVVVCQGAVVLPLEGTSPLWHNPLPFPSAVQLFHCVLGDWAGHPLQLCLLAPTAGPEWPRTPLRSLLDTLPPALFALLGRAVQLEHWYHSHQFCGRCGAGTVLSGTELCRHCPACEQAFYPRIAPCVLVLVSRGQQLLLAHHKRSAQPRYSLLAGFVEAGENAEDAVQREVYEEVGLRLKAIRYVASQAWPFPGQLMLGFFAEYAEGELTLDTQELVHADWFSPQQLPSQLPPPNTLSGQLLAMRLQEWAQA